VGDAVAALGKELGFADPRILGVLAQSWGDLVGPVLAAHARLRSVRGAVLTVGVDSGPWATEVRYLEAELLGRVAALVGPGAPHAIRVVVEDHPGTEPRP
jgi:predicted nucleic acid-binding Zn ribbon protein